MALTFTSLTSGEDGDGAGVSTESIALAADSVILVAVSSGLMGAAAAPSSLSGHGLTWTKLGDASITNLNLNASLWYALTVGAEGADTIDMTWASAPTNAIWEVVQVEGVDTADPIVQSKARGGAGFSFTNPELTFDAPPAVTSGIFGLFAKNNTGAIGVAGNGYTQIGTNNNDGGPSNLIFTQYDDQAGVSHDGVFDMSWDSSSGCSLVATEIAAAEIDPGGGGGEPGTITMNHLDSGSSTTDAASYDTTDEFTPTDNSFVVIFIATGEADGATSAPTSVTGGGITFSHIVGAQQGVGNQRIDIFGGPCTSPTLDSLVINQATTTENCGWVIAEFLGVDLDDPIEQIKAAQDSGATNVLTFDAAAQTNGRFIGLVTGNTTSPNWSAGTGTDLIGDVWSLGTPSNKGVAGWSEADPATNPLSFNSDGTPNTCLAGAELRPAAGEADPISGQATMAGEGSLTAEGERVHGAVAFIDGTGTLTAAGTQETLLASLTGTVLDISGDPLPGITVTAALKPPGVYTPDAATILSASTTTDDNGVWVLGLSLNNELTPAGSYYVITEERESPLQWVVHVTENGTLDAVIDYEGDGRVPALLLFSGDLRYAPGTEPGDQFPGLTVLSGSGSLTADADVTVGVVTVIGGDGSLTAEATVTPGDPVGIMYGWHQDGNDKDELRQIETAMGKNFAIVRMFESDNRGTPSADALDLANDHGGTRTLMWSVKSTDWAGVAAGNYDAWIEEIGADLNGCGAFRVIFIFYHEPHDNFGGANGSADEWVQAVRQIHDVFRANDYLAKDEGEGIILIGYCAIKSKIVDDPDPIWDAGNDSEMRDIIDVLCHDSYNQIVSPPGQANRLFGSADNVQESWHQLLELSAEFEKPMIISEWGCFSVRQLDDAEIRPPGVDDETCDAWGFHPDLIERLEDTDPLLPGGPYSGDRDGWFEQAAYFMKNDPLAKVWLKGFAYYHSRRWMFSDTNGDAHLSGCSDDTTDTSGVEGIDGWMAAFVGDSHFKAESFDPLTSTPSTPDPEDPPPGDPEPCTSRSWSTGPAVANGIPSALGQISGIASSPNHPGFWAVRDDTADSVFYLTETSLGSGTFTAVEHAISGASNGDWEDIAVSVEDGTTYIYVHSNRGNSNITSPKRLYRVIEPADPTTPGTISLNFTRYWWFPTDLTGNTCPGNDQDGTPDGGYFNCEGIEVYNGRLYAVRKRSGGQAEVFDFGPTDNLSASSSSPTVPAEPIGTISHGCPSTLALSSDGRSLLTVSHGTARIWRALGGGSGILACLDGNNELVEQISLPALDGDPVNTEAGDWWPYDTCDVVIASESRNSYQFTGD